MSLKIDEIEREAMQLPAIQRAALARYLLESLEGNGVDETAEQAWVEEASARHAAYRRGEMASAPMAEVFERARNALKHAD